MKKILHSPSFLPEIITLIYHRIDTSKTDPWGICVSAHHFEEHIKFLKNNFNVISSKDLIKQVTTGNIINDSICITFDDGYADNYVNAKPILERYNCPATFFIATAFINETTPFWWDELEIILLHSINLPEQLLLRINGKDSLFAFEKSELTPKQLMQQANWKWHQPPPTDRCTAFLQIWNRLRPLSSDEIKSQMAFIRKWADTNTNFHTLPLPMNEHQLSELSKNNQFTIALHTHTHPDLEGKTKHFQVEEILSCKKILRSKYGIDSYCLAYPYGRYNNDTIKAVKDLDINACFTTFAASINTDSDLTTLGRYQVFDGCVTSLKHQLKI